MAGHKKSAFESGIGEVVIRRFQASDFDHLSSLYMDFYNELRESQGQRSRLDKKEADRVARESLEGKSYVFLAENHRELVGFARVQFWEGAYFVREVFVKKPFRRNGLGSKLLTSCEDLVLKNGETSIYLTVEPKHSVSIKYLIHNGYDTLNMLELRKDLTMNDFPERQDTVEILGHKLRLLKRGV
ncbi:MAG: GNAT family N-acetyltransferase [Candidatus Bathyarchaeota archaeon]|nr:GNAT family N-acetyltransferase [Candidatus Bathyarchaeota archaeon]